VTIKAIKRLFWWFIGVQLLIGFIIGALHRGMT
jgi:hypothetical protein